MSSPLFIFYVLLGLFGSLYIIFILFYTYGWFRLKTFTPTGKEVQSTRISVIIPARNEGMNIGAILDDLLHQSLSGKKFEVILVDDHSTDNTVALATAFREANPSFDMQLIRLSHDHINAAFKKRAIREAINVSTGELIVTTDADCRVGNQWLETLLAFYEKEKPKMIVGPVSFHNEASFFEKMQTEEFLSLIAITGGAIRIGKPIMCNGANLAYEKSAFYEAGGFGSDKFSSGDDVFLMLQIRKIFGNRSIRFLKSYQSLVLTEAKKSLAGFFQQRTRWASKNKGYEANILLVSFTVYMINLLILGGLIWMVFNPGMMMSVLIILIIKVLIDVPVLIGIGNFVKRPGMVVYALPLVVLYPFYIVLVGALGMLGNYNWKGRKVKN